MKAAYIRKHGEADVIEVGDLPDPKAGPGEVVVAVKAAALNHLDIWVRQGGRISLDFPHVLGSDAAGTVLKLGEGVSGFEPGQEVVVNPGLCCGDCEFCRAGQQSQCIDFGIVGMARPGTFAERVAVPARCLWPKPRHLGFDEAAALVLDHLTAWRMLMTRAGLGPGHTVLIHGVGGGAAMAGLQLAKLAGAWVVATSSSEEKLDHARRCGADAVLNYTVCDDLAAAVRELTGGRGVDVAFDTVGAETLPVSLDAVRRGGTVVNCGVTTGPEATVSIQKLYWNQLNLLGSTLGSDEDCRRMLQAVVTAGLEPIIDSIHDLDSTRQAVRRMEAGRQIGKIVLHVAD